MSWFGSSNLGAGGDNDIAQNAKALLFTGSFTTAGPRAEIGDGGPRIASEGKVSKLVRKVEQIAYPVAKGVGERGQKATLITKRAIFAVEKDDLC